MTARERPWMKWYPSDWRSDPRLRNCGLSARGLWKEMLALMHESERYGHLLVNGKSPTDRQLAIQVGATIDEVTAGIAELEAEGVFSRDRNGTIYSRRMIRDEKKAEHARKIGKKGGNPTLSNKTGKSPQDNGQDKPTDNGGVKPHKPEARVQRVDSSPTSRTLPADIRSIMAEGGFISPPPDCSLLTEWYGIGANLDQDILPTVRRVKSGLSKPPFKLKVFDAAIREKLAEDEARATHLRRIAERNKPPQTATG